MEFTQERRRIAIETTLGQDALVLNALEGSEQLSAPFSYRVSLLSQRDSIAPKEIVGTNVTITLFDPDDEPHHVNGYVRQFINHGRGDRATMYSAEIVPWLWFLTRRTDCRIFQDKTIPQIIEEVFQKLGFTDYEVAGLTGQYDRLDYCVQYRESDFDFVSRLMERVGIFYFFRHEARRHVLVLADSTDAYTPCKENEIRFAGPLAFSEVDDHLSAWQHEYEYRSGRIALADFNFETPQEPVRTKEQTIIQLLNNTKLELYDYPGQFLDRGGADSVARLRMQEEEAAFDRVHGTSRCRSFRPGQTFTIEAHHIEEEVGRTYVLTSVRHRAEAGSYVPGAERPEGYQNDFECMPASVLFRPPRVTPRSIVRGPQTAVVTGPPGEEIHTDKYGRVKVLFHWDRYNQKDENSSCWIRVSQAWAGKGYGNVSIPRVGQEVIVDFLEGDPDRPIITGRVYNPDQGTPQALPAPEMPTKEGSKPIAPMQGRAGQLPACKTRTTIRTASTPGGGGANEICFDDAAGKELFHMNASKDCVVTVKNDQITNVGIDCYLSVGNNLMEFIGANHDLFIGADQDIQIVANQNESVGADQNLSVGADQVVVVGANRNVVVGANENCVDGANFVRVVGGTHTLNVTGTSEQTIGGKLTLTAGEMERTSKGEATDTYKAGHKHKVTADYELEAKSIKITGKTEITLVVGGSSIKLDASGITIFGPLVKIN